MRPADYGEVAVVCVFRWGQSDPHRLMPWLTGLACAAATEAAWHWWPRWVPVLRIVCGVAGAAVIAVLATEAIGTRLRRHRNRSAHDGAERTAEGFASGRALSTWCPDRPHESRVPSPDSRGSGISKEFQS